MELEYAWNAKMFGGLPYPGGQVDQPAGLMRKMRAVENAYEAWMGWKQHKGDVSAYIKSNPTAWKIVKNILDMRRDG